MARIAVMTIRIEGPDFPMDVALSQEKLKAYDDKNQKIVDSFNWGRIEDAANDQLPEGYYCKIEE